MLRLFSAVPNLPLSNCTLRPVSGLHGEAMGKEDEEMTEFQGGLTIGLLVGLTLGVVFTLFRASSIFARKFQEQEKYWVHLFLKVDGRNSK